MVHTKKYSYIDSLRGYAVLMVLVCHVYAFGGGNNNPELALSKFWVQCRMGVMLFYIISALTLFLSYDQKIKIERYPVTCFFIRRIFRIVPLFYLFCIGMICFDKFDYAAIIGTFTFSNGFMPKYIHGIVRGGWSIAIEMIFYLFVPILFKYINTIQKSVFFFFFSFALAILLRFLAFHFLMEYVTNDVLVLWTNYWLPIQLPVFSIGIFLYFVFFKSGFNLDDFSKFRKPLSYLLVFSSIYLFLVASYSSRLFIYENISFSIIITLLIIGFAFYPATIFNNKLMQFFGKISYSFYLFHPIVIILIGENLLNNIGKLVKPVIGFTFCYLLILSVTSLVSYISYKLIEQPFQKLGAKLIKAIENPSRQAQTIS
jgi:peptidoglycan/LPS O-acetylase OafA/YrhL